MDISFYLNLLLLCVLFMGIFWVLVLQMNVNKMVGNNYTKASKVGDLSMPNQEKSKSTNAVEYKEQLPCIMEAKQIK